MSVCHVYTDVHGWQKRALDFLELMLVSCLTWILGPKLVPSEEMGRIHFYCWRRMLNISVTNKNSEVRLQVQSKSYTVCSTYRRATLWTASCIKAGLICSLTRKAYERFCILLKMSYGKTKSDDSSIEKKNMYSVFKWRNVMKMVAFYFCIYWWIDSTEVWLGEWKGSTLNRKWQFI